MDVKIITNRMAIIGKDYDIIVLKGFPNADVLRIAECFDLLDRNIFDGEKIELSRINAQVMLFTLLQKNDGKKSVMTYETFLQLVSNFRDLSVIGKKFCILNNNLLTNFVNPTTSDIPDFDDVDFQNNNDNAPYCFYYDFCMHVDGKQYVRYIDTPYELEKSAQWYDLIPPTEVQLKGTIDTTKSLCRIPSLSPDDGTLDSTLQKLYSSMSLPFDFYAVEAEEKNNPRLGVLCNAAKILNLPLTLYTNSHDVKITVRPELGLLLKTVWGYDSFRSLKIYKDLTENRDIIDISQGEIIENVVRQGEAALKGDPMMNILLTSPTGAGKSLLFQLTAIYMAEKYKTLTIVVSPLVALMNDQVSNLVGNYRGVATLNSNITATEKDEIAQKVKDGKVNILYLAPELLLSYSITTFVGERRIGLMVIDEAHTVTTWGRDFRVDYWFLGDYLRKAKRVLDYQFPIFALTATAVWDPTGRNDMVFDTIRSLVMDPCIKYIGVVKRDNIMFDINLPGKPQSYETARRRLTINSIIKSVNEKAKTIVYFPYKSTVNKIIRDDRLDNFQGVITQYHSSLTSMEKRENAEDFRAGSKYIMLATKAYGMGVDVPDINVVYHHAPTGCLSDYVQEIGRLARDKDIMGIARIDFTEQDFKYTRTLHGLSTIKSYQLRMVLKKLMALYHLNGDKRNMLISATDFEYIFPSQREMDPEQKMSYYDQKLKSCLLLISNDLLNKLRFNSIIVRPKNLFSKSYVTVPSYERKEFYQKYKEFLKIINADNGIYLLDTDQLWRKRYTSLSFPNFKRMLANCEITKGFQLKIRNKLDLNLSKDVAATKRSLSEFFSYSMGFLNQMAKSRQQLKFETMRAQLPHNYKREDKEMFMQSFKLLFVSQNRIGDDEAYCQIKNDEAFQLMAGGYEAVQSSYLTYYDRYVVNERNTYYCGIGDPIVRVSELLNSLGLADYQRIGGEMPSIFVRINNPNYLGDIVKFNNYENAILQKIYEKYEYSEKVFTYFFRTNMTTSERWDFIENYFLGATDEELFSIAR